MPAAGQMFLDGCCDILGSDEEAQGAVWRRGVPFARRTVQDILDTFPRCQQLTLEQTGVAWAAQQED